MRGGRSGIGGSGSGWVRLRAARRRPAGCVHSGQFGQLLESMLGCGRSGSVTRLARRRPPRPASPARCSGRSWRWRPAAGRPGTGTRSTPETATIMSPKGAQDSSSAQTPQRACQPSARAIWSGRKRKPAVVALVGQPAAKPVGHARPKRVADRGHEDHNPGGPARRLQAKEDQFGLERNRRCGKEGCKEQAGQVRS